MLGLIRHNIFNYDFRKRVENNWGQDAYLKILDKYAFNAQSNYISDEELINALGPMQIKIKEDEVKMVNIVDTSKIPPYWKSKNHYDPDLAGFWTDTMLTVEEKIDGSQFSFGHLPNQFNRYQLAMKSKEKHLDVYGNQDGMFELPKKHLLSKPWYNIIPKDVVLRGEVVSKNRHNKVEYGRTPSGFIVVFGAENLLTGKPLADHVWRAIALELGLEPVMSYGTFNTKGLTYQDIVDKMLKYMENTSMLGGSKIEGVVLKRNGDQVVTRDGVPMFAKVVSQSFKEIAVIKKDKAPTDNVIQEIISMVNSNAVYSKAVQHLADNGDLEYNNRDIGKLITEIKKDISSDIKSTAQELLWLWAEKQVVNGCVIGFSKWYQQYLIDRAKGDQVHEVEVVGTEADTEGKETIDSSSEICVAADHD